MELWRASESAPLGFSLPSRFFIQSAEQITKGDAMTQNSRCVVRTHALLMVLMCLLPASLSAQGIPMRQMVELALKHSTASQISAASEEQALDTYRELKDSFIPQVTVGSGLGWSYGFPLSLEGSAPALFNVTAQSPLYHRELGDIMGAAQADTKIAKWQSKEQRNQTIQDTVLSYAELVKWERRIVRLQEAETDAEATQKAVQERIQAGVDEELDGTKAQLSVARIKLRISEAEGSAEVLRQRLSKLTGIAEAQIQADPDSIPAAPAVSEGEAEKSADSSPTVQAAIDHARAQYLRAQAEHKMWFPSFDFAAQYALLSTFNNFQNYYIPSRPCATPLGTLLCATGNFQRNNATVGVSIRFPFLNFSQRARAAAADAEAVKAREQAEDARNKASEQTLRLQHSLTQMQDAREVAELEYEIAQKNVGAVRTRMNAGTANLHDLDDAQSQLNERFITLQDATFEVERAQVDLLRATNGLETWALGK